MRLIEKKREHFSENFYSQSVLKYGICSLFPLKNCSNRGFSGLVVAWVGMCYMDCGMDWHLLHGLSSVLKFVVQQNLFFSDEKKGKLE